MLKLVSGQHQNSPGGALSIPAGPSASLSTAANLSVIGLDLAKSPAAALGPQHILQQHQGKPGASATPRTPQNLLAMVHLLDQQLQQLEQQYAGDQPVGAQGTDMQGPQQRDHSMEAPAVFSAPQLHSAAVAFIHTGSSSFKGPSAGGLAAQPCGKQPAAQQQVSQAGAPQPQQLQQQHTVEVPSLVSSAGFPVQQKPVGRPGQLHASSSLAAAVKAEAAAAGASSSVQQRRQDLLGQKAVDQATQHSRGLMAAGAYVLQPLKSGAGGPRHSRSPSPAQAEQPWLQHVDTTGSSRVPPVATAVPHQQQQRQAPGPQQPAYQQALVERAAAEAAATEAAASAAKVEQYNSLAQQHHALQQQQQQMIMLQGKHQQRQHRPSLPELQAPLPPRHPQQQQQQGRQPEQDTTEAMDIEDAAGALDMLSEIAAAAAAAEEMYAGLPTPIRPDPLNAQAFAAASGNFNHCTQHVRKIEAHQAPAWRASDASGNPGTAAADNAAAAAAATDIPAAAAAAIAAAEHSTGSRGLQTKRPRRSSDGAASNASDVVAQAFAGASSGPGAAGIASIGHAGSRDLKRSRMGYRHAAEAAAEDSAAAAHGAGFQQQHSHPRSTSRAQGAAADGAVVEDSHAGGTFVPVARTGSSAGPAAAALGPLATGAGVPMPAAIRAAVAELAALAAAAARTPGQARPQGGTLHAQTATAQQRSQLSQGLQVGPGAQAPARPGMPVAFLLRAPAASGNAAYLMYSAAPLTQQLQPRAQDNSANTAAAGAAGRGASTAPAHARSGFTAPVGRSATAAAGGSGSTSEPVTVPRRPAVKHTVSTAATSHAGLAAAAAAEEADAAAHDLAMFAAAAAAAAAAGTYHSSRPAVAPAASMAADGRRQRKTAAAAAAFIAAAVAATDDGTALVADDDGDDDATEAVRHRSRPHKRNPPQHQPEQPAQPLPAQHLDMLAAAATSSPDASKVVAHDSDSPAVARPAAAAAAGASHPRGRARAGSSGSGSLHDHDYDTDGTDGGAYVCEGEDPQDSDDQERQSNKNRSTKERVLSNRLAASRSYQRRKEEMVRLEHNHARLQMEHQAVQHALQEVEQELQVYHDIAAAFASHHHPSVSHAAAGGAADIERAAAAFAAGHAAMHGVLVQRVRGAVEHQQRQRQVHAEMVEEAAHAAAAAAEGFNTDGTHSSGSGSVSHCSSR